MLKEIENIIKKIQDKSQITGTGIISATNFFNNNAKTKTSKVSLH